MSGRYPPEAEGLILQAFDDDPTTSTRKAAADLGLSLWKVWSIMHRERRYPFHGLSWKCDECRGNCLFINEKSVNTVLSKKIDASLGQIKNEVPAIKDELLNHAVKETNPPADPPRYSDVLRNRTQPAIVIRPKNTNQSVTQTKTDILKSVDPVEANIHLGKVCDIKEGGIVLGCKSKADNLKLLSIAKEKLGDSYVIKEVAGINPRVRIVGLSGEYSDEQIRSYLLKGNPDVFCGDVECKVLKTYAVKKNRIFQSVLQIDRVSYVRVMKGTY
ncbi:unnamed protein product [Acanthoscelides obtectus]|uniref:Uncharacterized protein n=1 Tax=Acanthoscelides obtectus TaxID=200917 RepID=A0A9P0LVE9_ACAOB|nr:unnamed protein product [Acanthoscelides obtectus]CAK1635806.1 hypothetical protein AOBTE_LOCUS9522 [Acanthoscelides obtectus]